MAAWMPHICRLRPQRDPLPEHLENPDVRSRHPEKTHDSPLPGALQPASPPKEKRTTVNR